MSRARWQGECATGRCAAARRHAMASPPSCNSSKPSTKSKDWSAFASPRRIRKVTATIWSRRTGGCPSSCESAHLPVQSGSDRVLKLMHRGYTRERFLEIIREAARGQARHRASPRTSSSVFPARPRRTLRKRLSLVPRGGIRQRLSLQILAAQGHAGRGDAGSSCREEVIEERNARLLESGQRNRQAQIRDVRRAAGANPGRRSEQEECRAHDGPHALQQDRGVRRQRSGIAAS